MESDLPEFADITTVDGRPNEGDLIYYPLTGDLATKFVEREAPFFQLGQTYIYQMTAEIYEVGSIHLKLAFQISIPQKNCSLHLSVADGYFWNWRILLSETVTGSESGVTAEVSYWDRDTDVLTLINRTGNFITGETLTGGESTIARAITTIDNLTMETVPYADKDI